MPKIDTAKFSVHVLLFSNEEYVLKMIQNCGDFVDKIYVAYSEFPWSYNPNARNQFKNTSNPNVLKKSPYYDKIEVIEGVWDLDEDQRNSCLEKAKKDGYDYLLIQDADEFYLPEEYESNLQTLLDNPDYDYYYVPWYLFWKSPEFVVKDRNGSIFSAFPEFAVNLKKDLHFIRARKVNSTNGLYLKGVCYHLSYVLTDDEMFTKVNTWSHCHQFDTGKWYKEKWLQWNRKTKFLWGPNPSQWIKAVPFTGKLPKEILAFNFPKAVEYKETTAEKIKRAFKNNLLPIKFMLRDIVIFIKHTILKIPVD